MGYLKATGMLILIALASIVVSWILWAIALAVGPGMFIVIMFSIFAILFIVTIGKDL